MGRKGGYAGGIRTSVSVTRLFGPVVSVASPGVLRPSGFSRALGRLSTVREDGVSTDSRSSMARGPNAFGWRIPHEAGCDDGGGQGLARAEEPREAELPRSHRDLGQDGAKVDGLSGG